MLIYPGSDVMVSLRNISWPLTVHTHKAGLKDLHNLISTHTPHRLPFYSPTLLPPHSLLSKMSSSPQYISYSSTCMTQGDLWRKWGPKGTLPVLVFPPHLTSTWLSTLLNTCLWETLFLSRLYNLLPYQLPGHHPDSLLISHVFFYLLCCIWGLSRYFLGRLSPKSSGPELFPSPATLDVDSNLNPNLYLDTCCSWWLPSPVNYLRALVKMIT